VKLLRLLIILYALTFAVAPKIFDIVRTQRGYDAVGGEVFIFLVPLIIWVWVYEYNEGRKERKNERVSRAEKVQVLQSQNKVYEI